MDVTDKTNAAVSAVTNTDLLQQAGLVAIFFGLAVFLFFYALYAPKTVAKISEKKLTATPLSDEANAFDRYIRPILRNFVPQSPLAGQMQNRKLDKTNELILKSGNPWNLRAEEFQSVQMLFAAFGIVVGVILFVFPVVPAVPPLLWVFIMPIGFALIPFSIYNSRRIQRGDAVQRQLPEAIDLLVITLTSKTFEPAFVDVTEALPDGLLKEEFMIVAHSMNAGQSLEKSLMDFAQKTSSEDAENFAKAIVQSDRLGNDVSDTLNNQAQAARSAYEARIEKKIAKLSSTMMIPLVLTMIPALILIIIAPTMSGLLTQVG